MTLRDWEQTSRWLVAHQTTKEEIVNLLAVGDRDLQDSRVDGLSADSCMALAYERAGDVSDASAREMQDLASRLRDDVRASLKGNHPDLLSRA